MRGLQRAGRRSLVLGLIIVTALGLVLAPTAAGAAPGDNQAASAPCKKGGWHGLVDVNGREFKNQGQCVAAAVQGRLARDLNPQVSGPFTGTTSFDFGTQGCFFVFQIFDATFTTATGAGDLDIEGCVEASGGELFPFTGSFTLTAPSGGMLTGTVSGDINAFSGAFDLTLTVNTATGTLSGATGTVAVAGEWDFVTPPGNAITGTLTGQLG